MGIYIEAKRISSQSEPCIRAPRLQFLAKGTELYARVWILVEWLNDV